MSKLVVKKALEIIDSDSDDCQSTSKGKKSDKVSTNKYGLKKEQKRLKNQATKKKEKGKVICEGISSKRSTLEEFRIKQKNDPNLNKLKQLKKLKSIKVDKNVTKKILTGLDAMKRTRSQVELDEKDEPFFTEDDFQYYVRSIL